MEERQNRFLLAYTELRSVAPAARRAGVHRATIYRWRADPAFVARMDAAWEAGYAHWRRTVYEPEEAQRQAARVARQAALRPARQERIRRTNAARWERPRS